MKRLVRSPDDIRSQLRRADLPEWVREELEAELDWIERGRPAAETFPAHLAERLSVELGGPIPARFRHLQRLNADSGADPGAVDTIVRDQPDPGES